METNMVLSTARLQNEMVPSASWMCLVSEIRRPPIPNKGKKTIFRGVVPRDRNEGVCIAVLKQ